VQPTTARSPADVHVTRAGVWAWRGGESLSFGPPPDFVAIPLTVRLGTEPLAPSPLPLEGLPFSLFAALGFELRGFTLSHSSSPF
jgi:hypothetical protein